MFARHAEKASIFQLAFGVGPFQVQLPLLLTMLVYVISMIVVSTAENRAMIYGLVGCTIALSGLIYLWISFNQNSTILGAVEFRGLFLMQMVLTAGLCVTTFWYAIKEYRSNRDHSTGNAGNDIVSQRKTTALMDAESTGNLTHCPSCGTLIHGEPEFCKSCGIDIEWALGLLANGDHTDGEGKPK